MSKMPLDGGSQHSQACSHQSCSVHIYVCTGWNFSLALPRTGHDKNFRYGNADQYSLLGKEEILHTSANVVLGKVGL